MELVGKVDVDILNGDERMEFDRNLEGLEMN
jgi:hypothetical protein